MKTAIYQYWYGSKPKESANAGRKNMEAYANKIGADYIFMVGHVLWKKSILL